MGFRFRRSIKLLAGVRLNLSKSGVSTSLPHVTLGHGQVRQTVGLPGTGISYTESHSMHAHPQGAAAALAARSARDDLESPLPRRRAHTGAAARLCVRHGASVNRHPSKEVFCAPEAVERVDAAVKSSEEILAGLRELRDVQAEILEAGLRGLTFATSVLDTTLAAMSVPVTSQPGFIALKSTTTLPAESSLFLRRTTSIVFRVHALEELLPRAEKRDALDGNPHHAAGARIPGDSCTADPQLENTEASDLNTAPGY
jgi:hypothetical protein